MEISSLTDIGEKREMNQDYFYSSEEAVGHLPNLFLVADGMGGHKAGEFASRYAVEMVVDTARKSRQDSPAGILSESIQTANRRLKEYADTHVQNRGMGTTLVAATLNGAHLLAANVGDSRLYLVGDRIRQITRDHSLVQEMVRLGKMDEDDARNHPDKNIITRALGADDEVRIDFFEVDVRADEKVLLCTDGLTNMLDDASIREILSGSGRLEEKTEQLIWRANRNGGRDNITVIVIEPGRNEE